MQFHEKVRLRVQELGLNKAKAARDAGLPESTISNYLTKLDSLPRIDIARKIAVALDVPLDWLANDDLDYPPPKVDPEKLHSLPDDVLMDEMCRRLINQAKRVAFNLERVKKENWPKVADELLAIPPTKEITQEQERMSFLIGLLSDSSRDLQEFDATRAIKRRQHEGPDLDDLIFYIGELKKMPEFDALKAYFDLRFQADVLTRHNATAEEWKAYDLDGHRKKLIASLALRRKSKSPKA